MEQSEISLLAEFNCEVAESNRGNLKREITSASLAAVAIWFACNDGYSLAFYS